MDQQPLKAQFFITRQNSTMVPLVALDELPNHIVIRDVPRSLALHEIVGMTCVGRVNDRHQKHTVVNMIQSPSTPLNEQGLAVALMPSNIGTSSPDQVALMPSSSPLSIEPMSAHAQTTHPGSSTTPAPRGVKKYCTHWIRTGNCDFVQQGCLFKHEMPIDQQTLEDLGYRDVPSWYRQKYGVGSFLAAEGAAASFNRPDVRSVIASTPHPQTSRTSINWRSSSTQETSDSGSDSRHNPGPRIHRPLRNRGRGSPLNPKPRNYETDPILKGKAALYESKHAPQKANLIKSLPIAETIDEGASSSSSGGASGVFIGPQSETGKPAKRGPPHRRVSLVSVISDVETDIIREDAERKAREEADLATGEAAEHTQVDTEPTANEDSKSIEKVVQGDASMRTGRGGGSVSGAANRRGRGRGGRGGRGN